MNAIRRAFRLWRNPAWRHAHKSDLPTPLEWLILIIVMLLMSGSGWAYDTVRMREEAKEAMQTTERVMGCLNGQTSLGEYTAPDGSRWVTLCSTFDKRVGS